MPTDPDLEAIAKGLTKAQSDLLIEEETSVRSYLPAQKLVSAGLWQDGGDEYVIRASLTPLGKAVRAHLAAHPDKSEGEGE